MSHALVLGATGHIGAHVVRALLARGHAVRAAYRAEPRLHVLEDLPVERVRVDLNEPASLRAAADGCEWIFHAAGYYPRARAKRQEAVKQGIESTQRILGVLRDLAVSRIVFTSSAATIQRIPGRSTDERDAEPWPLDSWRSLYATVKIAMEQEVLRAAHGGLPIVIVNPTVCLGEYDAHQFSGLSILLYAKYRFSFYVQHSFDAVYTGDVGMGHVLAAERGRLGERYLLTGQEITVQEFARKVTSLAGVRTPLVRMPMGLAYVAAGINELAASLSGIEPLLSRQALAWLRLGCSLNGTKARQELGMPSTSLDEAIRRAITWFRQHRYLK